MDKLSNLQHFHIEKFDDFAYEVKAYYDDYTYFVGHERTLDEAINKALESLEKHKKIVAQDERSYVIQKKALESYNSGPLIFTITNKELLESDPGTYILTATLTLPITGIKIEGAVNSWDEKSLEMELYFRMYDKIFTRLR